MLLLPFELPNPGSRDKATLSAIIALGRVNSLRNGDTSCGEGLRQIPASSLVVDSSFSYEKK